MNFPWALCIARDDAVTLAGLRLTPGIEIAEAGKQLWLRGPVGDETLAGRLLALPATGRFEWEAPDRLRPLEKRIPADRLPIATWQPLNSWLQVGLPAAALPAFEPEPVTLQLVRSGEEREPDLLLARIEEFRAFAARTALAWLENLHFAAAADGRVLVRGHPLPSLQGRRFVLHGNVAVPAGLAWLPVVSADVLARRLGATAECLVLWDEDGTISRLHSEQLVPATRSAVLATERALSETR